MNDGGKYIFTFLDKDDDGLFKDMAEHADVVEFWPSHREDTRFNKPFKKLLMNHRIAKWGGGGCSTTYTDIHSAKMLPIA